MGYLKLLESLLEWRLDGSQYGQGVVRLSFHQVHLSVLAAPFSRVGTRSTVLLEHTA